MEKILKHDLSLEPKNGVLLVDGAVNCVCKPYTSYIHFVPMDTSLNHIICTECKTTYGKALTSNWAEVTSLLVIIYSDWCKRQLERLRLMHWAYNLNTGPKHSEKRYYE